MIMNTKSEYPVTDSITDAVEAGIIVTAAMSLIACEVTRHMGHALEGGVYKGVKSSWGLVKGARQRLVTYRERISEKVATTKSEEVAESAVADEEIAESQTVHHDTAPGVVPVQPREEVNTSAPVGMTTPALA